MAARQAPNPGDAVNKASEVYDPTLKVKLPSGSDIAHAAGFSWTPKVTPSATTPRPTEPSKPSNTPATGSSTDSASSPDNWGSEGRPAADRGPGYGGTKPVPVRGDFSGSGPAPTGGMTTEESNKYYGDISRAQAAEGAQNAQAERQQDVAAQRTGEAQDRARTLQQTADVDRFLSGQKGHITAARNFRTEQGAADVAATEAGAARAAQAAAGGQNFIQQAADRQKAEEEL